MKLKFDPALEYQKEAIHSVVNVLEGQAIVQEDFVLNPVDESSLQFSELGIANNILLDDDKILKNVHAVQEANRIKKNECLEGREFSIEMETGTGKTYVYLRTIFELSKNYGLKKFIIVVPSIAIREGVIKSIDTMKTHFYNLYGHTPLNYFVYDPRKLSQIRQFAISNHIQIMIINIQSFIKDAPDKDLSQFSEEELQKLNIIYRENDKLSGRKPIEFIQATKPLLIIDEPQSVDNTPKAKRAITNLNPSLTLRYSATHRNFYNLLYKLDPIDAYEQKLVKRIEVASIRSQENFNDAYIKLLETNNKNGIKAKIEIYKRNKDGIKPTTLWVKQKDDLYIKSGEYQNYANGYIIHNIDCTPKSEYIEFSNGKFLKLNQTTGYLKDDIMKAQVAETIEQHLKKEKALKEEGIKVLSLFFIDRVANYRQYNDDGSMSLGKIGKYFEEAYKSITSKAMFQEFACSDLSKIHNGYFSQDKGRWKDTEGKSSKDEDTYNLIMREKERLLDPEEPLRFIFSHSALREGWDNPNIFQICTLNESRSYEKKRQEIGRGLRLPVNKVGDRIHDKNINRLTIIANESYEEFAKTLQTEMEEDYGIVFGQIDETVFSNIMRRSDGTEESIGQSESIKIWEALKEKAYIDEEGKILEKFDPDKENFEFKINKCYDDIQANIIDTMKKYIFANRISNAKKRKKISFKKEIYLSESFQELWNKIKCRTRYRVYFETRALIDKAVERIKNLENIQVAHIGLTRVGVALFSSGVSIDEKFEDKEDKYSTSKVRILPDLLAYLQKETELTRHTLLKILTESGKLEEFKNNPQKFMMLTAREISYALHDLMIKGIEYKKIKNHYWEMHRIEDEAEKDITRYLSNLYEVKNKNKYLFDNVEYDSEVEKQFAKDLDNNEYVKLFVKLPNWFKIDTPIGSYNPDWAFITEREEKLYFVRETKSTSDSQKRRTEENHKISCGKQHFKSIGVNFGIATKLSEVSF